MINTNLMQNGGLKQDFYAIVSPQVAVFNAARNMLEQACYSFVNAY